MPYDTTSPPGSWQREIDHKLDTPQKLWAEIYELRSRIRSYLYEIDQLKARIDELETSNAHWLKEP